MPKLMTRGKFVLLVVAAAVGSSLSLFREFEATGTVTSLGLVCSLIGFALCVVIICTVGWWANRPLPEENHE